MSRTCHRVSVAVVRWQDQMSARLTQQPRRQRPVSQHLQVPASTVHLPVIDGSAVYVTRCLAIGFDELIKMAALDVNMPCLIFNLRNMTP